MCHIFHFQVFHVPCLLIHFLFCVTIHNHNNTGLLIFLAIRCLFHSFVATSQQWSCYILQMLIQSGTKGCFCIVTVPLEWVCTLGYGCPHLGNERLGWSQASPLWQGLLQSIRGQFAYILPVSFVFYWICLCLIYFILFLIHIIELLPLWCPCQTWGSYAGVQHPRFYELLGCIITNVIVSQWMNGKLWANYFYIIIPWSVVSHPGSLSDGPVQCTAWAFSYIALLD